MNSAEHMKTYIKTNECEDGIKVNKPLLYATAIVALIPTIIFFSAEYINFPEWTRYLAFSSQIITFVGIIANLIINKSLIWKWKDGNLVFKLLDIEILWNWLICTNVTFVKGFETVGQLMFIALLTILYYKDLSYSKGEKGYTLKLICLVILPILFILSCVIWFEPVLWS